MDQPQEKTNVSMGVIDPKEVLRLDHANEISLIVGWHISL